MLPDMVSISPGYTNTWNMAKKAGKEANGGTDDAI